MSGLIMAKNAADLPAPASGNMELYFDADGNMVVQDAAGEKLTILSEVMIEGISQGMYPRVNIKAGANVSISGSPNSSGSGIDITISSTGGGGGGDGWQSDTNTWTYSSADRPTFVISVNADMTGTIGVGYRIKLTQTTVKYFVVTAVGSYSGGATLITLYGGTDYTLANAAVSDVYFSNVKTPFGFPQSKTKWTVTATDTSNRTQSSPTASQWYGTDISLPTISVPIGAWNIGYDAITQAYTSATKDARCSITLSSGSASESNPELTALNNTFVGSSNEVQIINTVGKNSDVSVASKTTFYLLIKTAGTGQANIAVRGDQSTTKLYAKCAYL